MKGPFKGLGIQVISKGRPLKLYDDPDVEPAADPRKHQRYVEAVTGAIFKIKVSLHKHFKLGSLSADDAVRVIVIYDNDDDGWSHDFVVNDLRQSWSEGKPLDYTFWSITTFDEASQQWKTGATTFSALDITDTPDSSLSPEQITTIGRIKVKVQRVHRLKHARPRNVPKDTPKPITEASEKMLKGQAIVNNIRTTGQTVAQQPLYSMYDSTPLAGVDGRLLTTIIFYRSRRTLQMLGCIPRSPSPSPEIEPSTPGPDAAGREQKIKDLRAQLALLEGNTNIKAELPDAKRRIKREIEDTEELQITEARSARKKARHSGAIETVDLTDD